MKEDLKILASIFTVIAVVFGLILFLSKPQTIKLSNDQITKSLIKPDSLISGPANAKVQIVEFADMQCPACASVFPAIANILKKYPENVNYVFRHYPLPQHQNAQKASLAVEAAASQGKFKEMQEYLFANQSVWSKEQSPDTYFQKAAESLKLDLKKFQADYIDPNKATKITNDVADGNSLGVNSTPTIFINGQKYQGGLDQLSIEKVVENLLK